jgi:hypothetical protein
LSVGCSQFSVRCWLLMIAYSANLQSASLVPRSDISSQWMRKLGSLHRSSCSLGDRVSLWFSRTVPGGITQRHEVGTAFLQFLVQRVSSCGCGPAHRLLPSGAWAIVPVMKASLITVLPQGRLPPLQPTAMSDAHPTMETIRRPAFQLRMQLVDRSLDRLPKPAYSSGRPPPRRVP